MLKKRGTMSSPISNRTRVVHSTRPTAYTSSMLVVSLGVVSRTFFEEIIKFNLFHYESNNVENVEGAFPVMENILDHGYFSINMD